MEDYVKSAVIFGGTGFIGSFFSKYLLDSQIVDKVFLVDMESFEEKKIKYRSKLLQDKNVSFVKGDVRESLDWLNIDNVYLICNFAAIHREPGHMHQEYFETNIKGAINVCTWSEKVSCKNIIFSSSISPYGNSKNTKDEKSLPMPTSPYGISKLVAEKIHESWFNKDLKSRKLIIARPGVVFGPGEGGNVTRLIKALKNFYFFYMGNKNISKAGIYIKELCNILIWEINRLDEVNNNFTLMNVTMDPAPSVKDYADSICKIGNWKRFIPNIGYFPILAVSYFFELFIRPFGLAKDLSPVRVKKLVSPNQIAPLHLKENEYEYQFNLEQALLDWKIEKKSDW